MSAFLPCARSTFEIDEAWGEIERTGKSARNMRSLRRSPCGCRQNWKVRLYGLAVSAYREEGRMVHLPPPDRSLRNTFLGS